MIESKLPSDWHQALKEEFSKDYYKNLQSFLNQEMKIKNIFPQSKDVFAAFKACPLNKVKVVILGQDPYHGKGQAHGLSFSVPIGVKIPPSLRNIFKELKEDLDIAIPEHGNLLKWAQQGVLLLNNVLTVEEKMPASHQKKGWEQFTDSVIEILNQKQNLVFILWGAPAQRKGKSIDSHRHLVIKEVHPSPLSAYRGFFGSRPFSQTNAYLEEHGKENIDWSILSN